MTESKLRKVRAGIHRSFRALSDIFNEDDDEYYVGEDGPSLTCTYGNMTTTPPQDKSQQWQKADGGDADEVQKRFLQSLVKVQGESEMPDNMKIHPPEKRSKWFNENDQVVVVTSYAEKERRKRARSLY